MKPPMTMTKQTCNDCGEKFDGETYKTLCRSCFIEFKKNELVTLKSKVERLERENESLKSTSGGVDAELLKKIAKLERDKVKARGEFRAEITKLTEKIALMTLDKYADAPKAKIITISGIDADLLKRLRQLCHPDKHAGSSLSTNVFTQLSRL